MATTRSRQFLLMTATPPPSFCPFFQAILEFRDDTYTCYVCIHCYLFHIPSLCPRRQIVSADAPLGVSKDSKTIYATPMESKFGIDFM